MILQQAKGLADAGQHAQPQHIDLEDAQRVDIVLVPFDDGPVLHRRILDGRQFVQPSLGDDETADMLGQVPGKADEFADQADRLGQAAVLGVKPQFSDAFQLGLFAGIAPDLPRQTGRHILAEPHDLAHLADRRARAEMDHRGAKPGPVTTVFPVNPLDDLFPSLMFEIDVDIRRFLAVAGNESFKDHPDPIGFHIRDPQQIAQDRIGRRSAPLAEDAFRPGELNDVVHGEEIRRKIQLLDDSEFLGDQFSRPVIRAVRVAASNSFLDQPGQTLHRRFRSRGDLIGIGVAELTQIKGTAPGDLQGAFQRGGMVIKQPSHILAPLQAAFGIGQGIGADLVDGAAQTQTSQHIGQLPPRRAMHQHVAHRHQGRRAAQRQLGAGHEPSLIRTVVAGRHPQKDLPRKAAPQGLHLGRRRLQIPGQRNQDQPLAPGQQIGTVEVALPLRRPPLAQRQQPRQPLIGGQIGRQGDPFDRAVAQHQPGADDQSGQMRSLGAGDVLRVADLLSRAGIHPVLRADLHILGGLFPEDLQRAVSPHYPRQRIAVGDGDGLEPQFCSARHQLLGMRGPGEEGEIRSHAQFGIAGSGAHANSPCTNQPGFCGV